MCFPIDAVGKLVYDNTIEFERILFWKEANTMTFRYTIAKNNMMMRMLFSRAYPYGQVHSSSLRCADV